jgi:sugar (pentulose or hexulose) kinase
MKYLGIDIGSTTIKGCVLDLARGAVENVRARLFPEPIAGLPSGRFEVDPEAAVKAVRELLVELSKTVERCEGVFFCSQMGGLVLTDDDNRPLSNYISWRDQRSLEPHNQGDFSFLESLRSRIDPTDFARIGAELAAGSELSLLFWLAATGALPKNEAFALNLGDYVVARLCDATPKSEFTLALGAVDLTTRNRPYAMYKRLGLDHVGRPALVDYATPAGSISLGGRSIPCFPAVGDHQAALLGAGATEGELSINISTGSQVALIEREPRLGNYQTRCFFNGEYLNTITHLPAGRSLTGLIDLLCEIAIADGKTIGDPWSIVDRAAARVGETEVDVSLAFFAGPTGNRGHIKNLRLDNLTVGDLFRAAFKNMVDNYERFANRLSPDRDWKGIVLSGSAPRRLRTLTRMIEERFELPTRIAEATEETLTGLLNLAIDYRRKHNGDRA